jgi:diaminohydroxyphosphoribosylaminopyrimidine deaminase/5-amino-6-(5-phosphoribosylamino)uracil reductase
MATVTELAAMRRAVALSAAGLDTTSPNPPVGCVILDAAGRVVGEGYHRRKGESHAEVNALTAAGNQARGGTAVVTLEPCNHHGRTPPCHQALLDAGIARTVVAVIDPTSRGEGGVTRLRRAGMDVEVGVLTNEALLVLGPWLTALETARPLVIWAYVVGAAGIESAVELPEAAYLLTCADAVLHEDGLVTETTTGSHGTGALKLAPVAVQAGPKALLTTLYDNGIRSVMLHGGLRLTEPFLAAGLINRVVAYLPITEPSTLPAVSGASGLLLIPDSFRIVQASKGKGYVCVVGEPEQHWS